MARTLLSSLSKGAAFWVLPLVVQIVSLAPASAQLPGSFPPVATIPDAWMSQVKWRCIGPANMGGRITAIAVYEKDPTTWWAASASGGLVKTTNNGNTFEHQFDRQSTVSIGDVQVSNIDSNTVWVGTGEANPRNSVSWGDGVYKSTDGGKTWTNKGLKKSFQVGRIAIHPTDPNTVFVGALGRLWGKNEERGLYKTADGGETWKRVLFVDDKTGVIDVRIDPANPNNVLAATYERMRDGFDGNDPIKKYGSGAGIYRSTDGGETFVRVTQGLPSVNLGRIGLDFYATNTSVVYAIIETEKIAKIPEDSPAIAIRTVDAEVGARVEQVTKDSVAEKAGILTNDIIVAVGTVVVHTSGQFWKNVRLNKAGDKIRLEISREKKPVSIEIVLDKAAAENGQTNASNPFTGTLGGQAANLQDQQGATGINYGGVYQSNDGGLTWARINTLNPRPMYYSQIRVDPKDNQNLYVLGTSMHRSKDGGKEFLDGGDRGVHPDHHALWIDPRDPRHMILGNDGGIYVTFDQMENWDHLNHVAIGQFYHVGIDNRRDYWVYGGLQDNGSWGGPARGASGIGPVNTDWINVGGGDGFVCFVDPNDPSVVYTESQNGSMGRLNLATGQQSGIQPRPQADVRYRFNWKTPFALAPQNSKIFYSVGNYVFRSVAEGNAMAAISPEITNTAEGSGSAIALSPLEYGIVYAGTTDGAVWMTKDDGKTWIPIFSRPKREENAGDKAGPRPTDMQGIAGTWNGILKNDQLPEDQRKFVLQLAVDDAKAITGSYTSPRGASQVDSGEYDPATGKLKLVGHKDQITFTMEAEVRDSLSLGGTIVIGDETKLEFDASRKPVIDVVSGHWELTVGPADKPDQQKKATLKLETQPDKKLSGTVEIEGRSIAIDESKFDPASKRLSLNFGDSEHDYELAGTIVRRRLNASLDVDFGQDVIPTSGWRVPAEVANKPADAAALVGVWQGVLESESIPAEVNGLTITLEANPTNVFQGKVSAASQEFGIDSGIFDAATGELRLEIHNDNAKATANARVVGDVVVGTFLIAGGAMQFDFSAEKSPPQPKVSSGDEVAAAGDAPQTPGPSRRRRGRRPSGPPSEANESMPAQESAAANPGQSEEKPQEPGVSGEQETKPKPTAPETAEQKSLPAGEQEKTAAAQEPKSDDPVTGKWSGSFVGEMFRGDRGRFEMSLNRDAAGKISGSLMTSRGETKITGGSFDPATKKLDLSGASETSTVEIAATLSEGTIKGTATMGGGRFTVDIEATNSTAAPSASAAPPGKPLETLLPGPRWVSSITASRFDVKRGYITLDGHRSDDDTPYLFASEDQGQTWRSIRGNIPLEAGTVHVLREDTANENLLFVGCEFSAWASIDRGQSWTKISGLPTVAVHEIALHGTTREIVAATHGRSLWIADIDVLKQLNSRVLQATSHLFTPNAVVRWRRTQSRGSSGTRRYVGENPNANANIFYMIGGDVGQVEIVIRDIEGTKLKTLSGPSERGLQVVNWDFSIDSGQQAAQQGGRPGGREGGRRGQARGRLQAGSYAVEMSIDGALVHRSALRVLDDPKIVAASAEANLDEDFEQEVDELK